MLQGCMTIRTIWYNVWINVSETNWNIDNYWTHIPGVTKRVSSILRYCSEIINEDSKPHLFGPKPLCYSYIHLVFKCFIFLFKVDFFYKLEIFHISFYQQNSLTRKSSTFFNHKKQDGGHLKFSNCDGSKILIVYGLN